jgi:uncharacterized protein
MITTASRGTAAVLLALTACNGAHVPSAGGVVSAQVTFHTAGGRVETSMLDLARTPATWTRGLMGRHSLPSDGGMLFVFPDPTKSAFWMKDTMIPLSVAFWGQDGHVQEIIGMRPCAAGPCHRYRPHHAYLRALEMRRGWFARHGVEIGDRVDVEFLSY